LQRFIAKTRAREGSSFAPSMRAEISPSYNGTP
jgi:hypothetical protein